MDYCIYGLFDKNGLRYIGKTKTKEIKIRHKNHLRDETKCHRVNWIKSLTKNKQKPIIYIILDNLTEEESLNKEKLFIKILREAGVQLVNQTNGGEGISSYKHTKETRQKMSQSRLGHPTTPETKRKISKALKGRIVTGMYGKHHSKEAKKKISDSNLKTRGKPVLQLSLEGNIITSFKGISEAARKTGFSKSCIIACCKKKRQTHKGFRWHYDDGAKISP